MSIDKVKKILYVGQQFSRQFIEKEISPEDVISIHKTALTEVFPAYAGRSYGIHLISLLK